MLKLIPLFPLAFTVWAWFRVMTLESTPSVAGYAAVAQQREKYIDAVGLLIMGVVATISLTIAVGSNASAKSYDTQVESRYGLEISKHTESGFSGTDTKTGKTLKCSFTNDRETLVCNGEIRKEK